MLKWNISLYGKQFISYLVWSTFEIPSQYLYSARQAENDFLLPSAAALSLHAQTYLYKRLFVPVFNTINSEFQSCFDRMLQITSERNDRQSVQDRKSSGLSVTLAHLTEAKHSGDC